MKKIFVFLFHAISFLLIFFLAYFFGFSLINKPLSGSDALNNLTFIVFFDKYFPHIPLWFPYQGGGVSATLGYPQFYSYVVILVHRITGLTLVSAMGVVNFLSVLLPAWGCYVFVAIRLKKKTAALLAGIFYLLSPMVYVWIWKLGFLAQTFSVIFVPFYLLFFDWLLENASKGKLQKSALTGTVIFGALTFLAHPATYMGLVIFSFLYGLGRIFFTRKLFLKISFRISGVYILSTMLTIGIVAFWYLPLQAYSSYANQGMTDITDTSTFAAFSLQGVLGIGQLSDSYQFKDFFIFPPVWILGIAGVIIGFLYNRKIMFFSLLAILSLYCTGSFGIWKLLHPISPAIAMFFTLRPWYPLATILCPIAGAMGAVLLVEMIWQILVSFINRKSSQIDSLSVQKDSRQAGMTIKNIATLLIAFLFIMLLYPLSAYYNSSKPYIIPFGYSYKGLNMYGLWNRSFEEPCDTNKPFIMCSKALQHVFDINTLAYQCSQFPVDASAILCSPEQKKTHLLVSSEEQQKAIADCFAKPVGLFYLHQSTSVCMAVGKNIISQLRNIPLPDFSFGKETFQTDSSDLQKLTYLSGILTKENQRIDISAYSGSIVKAWHIINNSSFLNIYTGQISLIKQFYSLFHEYMYDNRNTSASILENFANYFGTQQLLINTEKTSVDKFQKAGWNIDKKEKEAIVTPPFKTGLVSIGNMPKILVIGNHAKKVYQDVFRIAAQGALPFGKGIVIEGSEKPGNNNIFAYDAIILQGYTYANKSDLQLLTQYVKQGGSVFIDTGWQYVAADWNSNELPEPFPVTKTNWGGLGKDWKDGKTDRQFTSVSLNNFGSLSWEGQDWAVAAANNTRSFGKPILQKGNAILIARGELEKGKIVWSGMNLFGHIAYTGSQEEVQLLADIFDYLLARKNRQIHEDVNITRSSPDQIVITLRRPVANGESLYFREAFFPSWKAVAHGSTNQFLPIQKAGPGFMLVDLPALTAGDKIIFTFTTPKEVWIGVFVSILCIIVLIDIVTGNRFGKILVLIFHKSKHAIYGRIKKVKEEFAKEDEDY